MRFMKKLRIVSYAPTPREVLIARVCVPKALNTIDEHVDAIAALVNCFRTNEMQTIRVQGEFSISTND